MPDALPDGVPDGAHGFAAPLLRQDGGFGYHYVPLPRPVADALAAHGGRRVVGTLNGHPFRRAVQGRAGGERHLVFGRDLLDRLGVAYGDPVEVEVWADPEPDRIDLGEEFEAVLREDAEAAARFFSLTPGRQRSLALYVTEARRADTRRDRALELARKLRTHTLYGDLHPGA